MSSNVESIFFVSSQTTSINDSKKSNMTSMISENISKDKYNNLFDYIKELAVNYDLPLPNKEKDSGFYTTNSFFLEQNSQTDINKEKIDKNILNDIFKILSKYSH